MSPAGIGGRLYGHGRAGADALVPLLAHPSEAVRDRAAFALDQFEDVPSRHLPALIAAHRRGLGVEGAIARTGSDEALRYLEAQWSFEDHASRVRDALPLFEDRAQPFLLRELERCRQGCRRREASALLYALGRIEGPLPDQARAVIRDVAASPTADPELRAEMEDQLILRLDRAGLPILVRRLRGARGDEHEEWTAARLIDAIQHYREAARPSAGPLLLEYLARPELRTARIEAVITSLVISYRPAIPAIRALIEPAERDWLATYHALWALAELDAREARPQIERVARDHWYRPVRNNARRALNMLDGGAFELPELGDEDDRGGYVGELNFAEDLQAVRDCRFDRAAAAAAPSGRDAPVATRWPEQGAARVTFQAPSLQARAVLGAVPDLPREAEVTLLWQRGPERIVGVDAGRWSGGLFAVEADSAPRRLVPDNVHAAFEMPDGLLVLTSDASGTGGDVWRLAGRGRLALADGPMRLPARAERFALASDRSLLIRTERGDVAVTTTGRLLPPRPCPAAAAAQ